MRFKIDWASLIAGSKFTVVALFYFVFEGNFPSTSPRGAYIWRGDLTEGFLRYEFGGLYLEGLIHGGAYFRNFTVSIPCHSCQYCCPSLFCFKTTDFYLAFIISLYFIDQHLLIILFDKIIRL